MKKYEIISEQNTELFRIRALVDMPSIGVKAGDFGGYVESEKNLSQEGEGWIFDSSVVKEHAVVVKGIVEQDSRLSGHVIIKGAHILASSLKDCGRLEDGTVITDSKLEHVGTKGKVKIENSIIYNFNFISDETQDYIDVNLKSDLVFTVTGTQLWLDTRLHTYRGRISASLEMSHCELTLGNIIVYEGSTMKHVVSKKKHFSLILGQENRLNTTRTMNTYNRKIIGKSMEEPLELNPKVNQLQLTLDSGSIEGNPIIEGNLTLIQSNIKDYAKISMNGSLENVQVSEFASIVLPIEDVVTRFELKNMELHGDSIYCEHY